MCNSLNLNKPVVILSGNEFLPKEGITLKDVLEKGQIVLPLDYCATGGKKQMTGMMAAPILIGDDSFICVVVVIFNLSERRLYLHETFLTEKIPEIAASSLVRGSRAASPQSQGSIAKILQRFFISK